MTPEAVARIVERRNEAAFLELLRAADGAFEDTNFEIALAEVLRAEPRLTGLWATWSADQRWSPSAYNNGKETGWYDAVYQHVRVHPDEADAVADFIHRTAVWVARGKGTEEAADTEGPAEDQSLWYGTMPWSKVTEA